MYNHINPNPQCAHADHYLQVSAPKKITTLKWRVGYMEEEIGTMQVKLGRMEIDHEEAEVSSQTLVTSSQNLD